jgi:hypothetical protein
MAYEFYHYPLDFLELYRTNIEKVTSDDVARVARKYVHKEEMPVLVVGNSSEMGEQKLSLLGKVTPVDISIPTGGADAPQGSSEAPAQAAPAAGNPEGKALAAKFVQALGGKEKISAVKAIEQKSTSLRHTPQGEVTIDSDNFVEYPDHVYSQLSTPMGQMTMAAWPGASYMNAGGQGGEMPPPAKEEALKSLKRDVIAVAQHLDDPKYTLTASGTRKIGDVQTNVLKINADGAEATWYLDPKTNLPLRSEFSALGQAGPVNRASDYSDWKSFSGVNLYTTRAVSDNGKPSAKDTIKEWVINPKIDPKIWEKSPESATPSADQPK